LPFLAICSIFPRQEPKRTDLVSVKLAAATIQNPPLPAASETGCLGLKGIRVG